MAYHLQHEEHPAMVQAAISSFSGQVLLISLSGEQVIANKLLLVLHSPILRELLMSEKSSNSAAISLPLSTEAIMALLDLLARGRTFSSQDADLLEVVDAGALLGLSLGKLQLGSRKVKTFKSGKCDLRDQGVGGLEGQTGDEKLTGIKVENSEMLNDELGEQQQKNISGEDLLQECVSARLDQNVYPSPNPREKSAPLGELTKTRAKPKPLNTCPVCDKDFIYPSLLNHHQKSVHHSELLNKESNELQCDSCQFSTPKLAFLKTHNKFMHPKTSL